MHSVTLCVLLLSLRRSLTDSQVDPNDILSNTLMPTSFLISDHDLVKEEQILYSNKSVDAALDMMSFHRKMMNEYLCRGFLSEKIMREVKRPLLEHRVGAAWRTAGAGGKHGPDLADQGSRAYKEWLNSVATLEDVYRHHGGGGGGETSRAGATLSESHRMDGGGGGGSRDGYEVYEDAVGFSLPPPHQGYSLPAVHKYGGGYEYPAPPTHQPTYVEIEKDSHGLGLSDLFEISLTALAFLSFGMFVLQVLMCITANKPQMTMQMIDNGDMMEMDDAIRVRRWADTPPPVAPDAPVAPVAPALNELSRAALRALRPRGAACHQGAICRSNSEARNMTDGGRFWLPLWNLSLSWVLEGASLSSLRAFALGLGGANCDAFYPAQC